MIPKTAHFYWGEATLPFLRHLTIYSFHKYNPDWKIVLYYPKTKQTAKHWPTHEHKYEINCPDYYPLLNELPITKIEFNFDALDIPNHLAEVHKSDFLRWYLLFTQGGLWSDMDIIYFKPVSLSLESDTYLCRNIIYGHSIGFLLSSPKNPVFEYLFQKSRFTFDPKNYQTVGANLLNKEDTIIKILDPDFINIPMDVVYPYDAQHIPEIFAPGVSKFTAQTIGLHWFAGHRLAGEYTNKITHENYSLFSTILTQAISLAMEEHHADSSAS